jgi:hypothetical protein
MVRFTDEEGFGRYLDLHEQHNMMLNLYDIFQERPQYLAYLTKFDKLAHIPKANKGNNAYRKYGLNSDSWLCVARRNFRPVAVR